jgi:hypothetical protein
MNKFTMNTGLRAKLNDVMPEGSPPSGNTLFHYTTLKGLYGMLKTGKLWATNINFLNDKKEYRHGVELFESRMKAKNIAERLRKSVLGDLEYRPWSSYVCSFSEERNQLSQWVAYCPGGNGVMIGFDFDKLYKNIYPELFAGFLFASFKKCLYKLEEQEAVVEKVVEIASACEGEELISAIVYGATNVAPFCKHDSFRNEREWRIVLRKHEGIEFREGQGLMVPYYELDIRDAESQEWPITSIMIGPDSSLEAKMGLELLLQQEGIYLEAEKSDSPYRSKPLSERG